MAKKNRRQTIGDDPLDSVIPDPARARAATKASKRNLAPAGEVPRKPKPRPPKIRFTAHLPGELIERCRDTVVACYQFEPTLTLAGMTERALLREIQRMEKKYNGGERFPSRGGNLRTGRPIQ